MGTLGPVTRVARTSGLSLVVLLWAALLAVTGSPEVLLFTVPVFMLAAPLALGRYLGEELIGRLIQAVRSPRRRPQSIRTRLPQGHSIRARLALGLSLSGRAPPAPF